VKCRKCGGGAALELRRHNAAFCPEHFIEFFKKQVAEAVHKHRMFTRDETVMVAVSGGKDSLALWDVLIDEGYQTAGLYRRRSARPSPPRAARNFTSSGSPRPSARASPRSRR
jgi:hypothetical protein